MLGLLAVGAGGQTLKVTPTSLAFSYQVGATALPAAQTLAVSPQTGSTAISFTAAVSGGAWATVSPDAGKTNASLRVTVNPASLAVGSYTATLQVTPSGGTATSVPITLTVRAAPSSLTVTPNPVTVSYTRGGTVPSPAALDISGNGALLSYTVAVSGAPWLSVSPKSGIVFPAFTSQVTLTFDPAGLAPGTYKGTVTVSAPSASNRTQAVEVTLTVNPGAPTLTSIFPLGATQGSGPVTITLNGTNFYTGTAVTAGSTALVSTVLGPTAIQTTLPAPVTATAGTVNLTVTNPSPGGGTATLQFTVYPPGPRISAITNAASFQQGAIAPGQMVSVFGTGLGPDTLTSFTPPAPGQPLATTLAGVQLLFGTTAAPLIFVSATQVVGMVPFAASGTSVQVTVSFNSATSSAVTANLATSAPGIFTLGSTGSGQGAVFNVSEPSGEYLLNSETVAATKGSTIVFFGVGAGVTNPAGSDGGVPASAAAFTSPALRVVVGEADAEVSYFGVAPGLISGLFQINARVPTGAPTGRAVPLSVIINGVSSQAGVTIAVK
jgi:uncharacterized protein (TIGR03437 family)